MESRLKTNKQIIQLINKETKQCNKYRLHWLTEWINQLIPPWFKIFFKVYSQKITCFHRTLRLKAVFTNTARKQAAILSHLNSTHFLQRTPLRSIWILSSYHVLVSEEYSLLHFLTKIIMYTLIIVYMRAKCVTHFSSLLIIKCNNA